ncbi:DUF72 domain-containing protein [Kozakia baliensis]|uniref:Uncharacterized protein n=1 Tax=Kozakia baliensis TaxID=153496 RepID=A0A1D8URA1_9PROT|nr:DUF72 domain-containing protein [Kozakia baliensis]AOX16161.1 hypothetical protein A0U89_02385 [Kozakia baliensis]GBR22995.1 hypothetical protein AA0488_0024 [Kozakia baliensis NRIC 0488]GEL65333.1 hypothetical protein KBA01_26190 [Kozakia baliensis]
MTERRIGIAGWSIPPQYKDRFPEQGSHLERYAQCFDSVEINSSFYRPHRRATYERWADSVPEGFRFAVKMPRSITHEARLVGCHEALAKFLDEIHGLGSRQGPILVQLPPSFRFSEEVADMFFGMLRENENGLVVCEPRHASWFGAAAEALLIQHRIARVAADPAPVPEAAFPGGWPGLIYQRLHGVPEMYYSSYDAARLSALAKEIRQEITPNWCIFDNTARGEASANALDLLEDLKG